MGHSCVQSGLPSRDQPRRSGARRIAAAGDRHAAQHLLPECRHGRPPTGRVALGRERQEPRHAGPSLRCTEEDSNLHPVIPDRALNLAREGVDPFRSCRSVQIVWSRERYGRIRRSGCCHGSPVPQQRVTWYRVAILLWSLSVAARTPGMTTDLRESLRHRKAAGTWRRVVDQGDRTPARAGARGQPPSPAPLQPERGGAARRPRHRRPRTRGRLLPRPRDQAPPAVPRCDRQADHRPAILGHPVSQRKLNDVMFETSRHSPAVRRP
jgi:hypothetical protein